MKTLLITLFAFTSLMAIKAEERALQAIMKSMGKGLKTSVRLVRRGDNSPEALKVVETLKEDVKAAQEVLPGGVNPDDEATVSRYRGLMGEVLEQVVLLEELFKISPLDTEAAFDILKELTALRKKGHGIFR